jgi:hypothetical protein
VSSNKENSGPLYIFKSYKTFPIESISKSL